MTLVLLAVAYACAVGLFGLAGIILFWLTAFAVAFLIVQIIIAVEVLAAGLEARL